MRDWQADIYNIPTYSVSDAARYLRIPRGTLRSWLKSDPAAGKQALIQRPDPNTPQLSFANLVEAHVLRIIRENHKIKLDRVRIALDYLGKELKNEHPLMQESFKTDGMDLFVESTIGQLVNASRSGQLAFRHTLRLLLKRVEWNENGIASRFFPFIHSQGDDSKILYLDPRIAFGRPVIAGKGVPTAVIVDLYEAGDEINDLADDYDCTPEQINAAIEFEALSRAA